MSSLDIVIPIIFSSFVISSSFPDVKSTISNLELIFESLEFLTFSFTRISSLSNNNLSARVNKMLVCTQKSCLPTWFIGRQGRHRSRVLLLTSFAASIFRKSVTHSVPSPWISYLSNNAFNSFYVGYTSKSPKAIPNSFISILSFPSISNILNALGIVKSLRSVRAKSVSSSLLSINILRISDFCNSVSQELFIASNLSSISFMYFLVGVADFVSSQEDCGIGGGVLTFLVGVVDFISSWEDYGFGGGILTIFDCIFLRLSKEVLLIFLIVSGFFYVVTIFFDGVTIVG